MFKCLALVASLLLQLAFASVCTGTMQTCNALYETGEYAGAAACALVLAEEGDAAAQYMLGRLYKLSQGVPRNLAEYERWIRKAARQGHSRAQRELGLMYSVGLAVQKDNAQAAKWYRKAAEQGERDSQYLLGTLLMGGVDIPMDAKEALMWFRKAAMQEQSDAQFELGEAYLHGVVVQKDIVMAYVWYSFAASDYYNRSHDDDRDALAATMTPEQLAQAEKIQHELWLEYYAPALFNSAEYEGDLEKVEK